MAKFSIDSDDDATIDAALARGLTVSSRPIRIAEGGIRDFVTVEGEHDSLVQFIVEHGLEERYSIAGSGTWSPAA